MSDEDEWADGTPAFFEGFAGMNRESDKSARKKNMEKYHRSEESRKVQQASSGEERIANILKAKEKIAAAVRSRASPKEILQITGKKRQDSIEKKYVSPGKAKGNQQESRKESRKGAKRRKT